MRYQIRGPLELADGERIISLAAPKQRALLAVLLLHANEVVSVDRLIDELWEQDVPATAENALQVYI